MKQTLLLLLAVICINAKAVTAEPVITMKTSGKIGSFFSFNLIASTSSMVEVDFGDGKLANYAIGTSESNIFGNLGKTQTIKIYGSNITCLNCYNKDLTALDVSKNLSLTMLNCSNNKLKTLDLTKNTALTTLKCYSNKLTTLNLSQNTALTSVECYSNLLTSLNTESNSELTYLECSNNLITSLTVSQNLYEIVCNGNNLTYSTLPSIIGKTVYTYAPQNTITIASTLKINLPLDLSSQLTANGNTTSYIWKTESGTILTAGTDYTINDGITTFIKVPTEKVYCEMNNVTFPNLSGTSVLKTTLTTIYGDPAISMTTTNRVGGSISFTLQSKADNTVVQVDFGDGILVEKTVGKWSSISGTLVGSKTVKIYGTGITYLECYNQNLIAIDVTNNAALQVLKCSINPLNSLDVTHNTALTELYCYSNQLTSLNVSQNTALTKLWCDSNLLTSLDVTNNTTLTHLDCSTNELTSLDVTKNSALIFLNCDKNQLSSLDVTKNTALTYLGCCSNKLASLDVTKNTALSSLSCLSNRLTSLNVTENTALTWLSCGFNQLSSLNVTKNTALTYLSCDFNQLSSLDVTKNTTLQDLSCVKMQLTSLDVTKNTALKKLSCTLNMLTSLDVTKNTALANLSCDYNQLTSLDVAKNTALKVLHCDSNQLTSLDLPEYTIRIDLSCENNQLTFATLPRDPIYYFTYAPQKPIIIAASFDLNTPIDLSSQLIANGNTTTYTWKTITGLTLTEGTDYSIVNGVTTFLKVPSDDVYCEMTNSTFPDLSGANVLKTTFTSIYMTATAVEPDKANDFELYARNQTVFLNLPAAAEVQVYDITGHQIKTEYYNSGNNSFEVAQKGIYVIKVNINNQVVAKKVVIK